MTPDEPHERTSAHPAAGTAARSQADPTSPCPPGRVSADQRPPQVRPCRRRRNGVADQLGRRACHRLLAGRRHRSSIRAFRSPIRRLEHRDHPARRAAGRRHRRCAQDQSHRRRRWPRRCRRRERARRHRRAGRPTHRDRRARRATPPRPTALAATKQRAAQTARKDALAAEAEELANTSTQWKVAGDRLRTILDEWKTITGLDRKTDDALWKRYSAARETFNRRRGSHFAELDRDRAGAREAKEKLCVKAEALVDSTDWGATSAEFRKLLVDWKAAGRAARDVDDALWARFKGAQDTFFKARNAATAERDAEFSANATAKEALLSEAEKTRHQQPTRRPRRRCGPSATSGTRSARFLGRSRPTSSGACARSRRRCATPPSRPGPTRRLRPVPTSSASAPSSTNVRLTRPRRRAAAKEAEEAKANAEQWRQWADAAADALTRKR